MSKTDFCIYCGEGCTSGMTKAHLFPKWMGGRIAPEHTCADCNCSIGSSIEGEAKGQILFALATDWLGLADKDTAYKGIRILTEDEGYDLGYSSNELQGLQDNKTGRRVGPMRSVKRDMFKWIGRTFGKESLEESKRRLSEGETAFDLGAERIHLVQYQMNSDIRFRGKGGLPFRLLAKIGYEAIWILPAFEMEFIVRFRHRFFKVDEGRTDRGRIRVSDNFQSCCGCLRDDLYGCPTVSREQLHYKRYHRIDLGVSDNGTVYEAIQFFGDIPFLIVLGKLGQFGIRKAEFLDNSYFFYMDQPKIGVMAKTSELRSWHSWAGTVADNVWQSNFTRSEE